MKKHFSIPSLNVLERKAVLLLLAQRIMQLPLTSKKLLAMYYYENLPISEIADCFNLPGCRIYEILTQTVGLLGNDLLKNYQTKCHLRNSGNNIDADGVGMISTNGSLGKLHEVDALGTTVWKWRNSE